MLLEIDKIYLSTELRRARNLEIQEDNTDVIVKTKNGNIYIAPFFSYECISRICKENQLSGNFLNGHYFWMNRMILIQDCSMESIKLVIDDLLEEGNFKEVFVQL